VLQTRVLSEASGHIARITMDHLLVYQTTRNRSGGSGYGIAVAGGGEVMQ
jgi:hypothetical protein